MNLQKKFIILALCIIQPLLYTNTEKNLSTEDIKKFQILAFKLIKKTANPTECSQLEAILNKAENAKQSLEKKASLTKK